MSTKINKENYYGNVEYKQELLDMDENKINKYATQLKFRIVEGKGKAIYLLGVQDDGTIIGVPNNKIEEYSDIMEAMSKEVDSSITDIVQIGIPDKVESIMLVKFKANFDINTIFHFYS